jgi:hydroxyacylglutathione hydrolase
VLMRVGNWGKGDIWRVVSGEFPSNAYICGTSKDSCILIDGGLDPVTIDLAIQDLAIMPTAVFCTHGHFDHAGSAAYFQSKYGCKVYLHGADHKILKTSNFMLMAFKLTSRIEQPSEITIISSADVVDVNGYDLMFHGAPGHTPGSCVIEFGSALFTGDTLYARGVGLSQLPGERPEILKRSILELWPMLTSDRIVYPGHGDWASGFEVRETNKELREFLGMPLTISSEPKALEL